MVEHFRGRLEKVAVAPRQAIRISENPWLYSSPVPKQLTHCHLCHVAMPRVSQPDFRTGTSDSQRSVTGPSLALVSKRFRLLPLQTCSNPFPRLLEHRPSSKRSCSL